MTRTSKSLVLLSFVLLAAGCGQSTAPDSGAAPESSKDEVGSKSTESAENLGSVDIAISGQTVGGNNKQCELNFELTNNTGKDVRRFYVEFEVSNAATGELLRADEPLVIPGTIQPGASAAPAGPIYIDGLDCAAVKLKPRDLIARNCRKDCAPFRYSAKDIAGV